MRIVAGLFALTLTASLARADEAAPPPAAASAPEAAPPHLRSPLRLVRTMPDTQQALLFDREKKTHVLVEAGGVVDGLKVTAIDDDEVTLEGDGGNQMVLAAPTESWRHRRAMAAAAKKPKAAAQTPEDPYAESGDGDVADGDATVAPAAPAPNASVPLPRQVTAPPAPRSAEFADVPMSAEFAEPAPAAPAPAAPAAAPPEAAAAAPEAPAAPAPAPAAAAAPAKPTAKQIETANAEMAQAAAEMGLAPSGDVEVTLARAEVNSALLDFGRLTSSVRGEFTADGVRIDGVVDGSLFARAGLRAGDLVTSVNGAPVRGLDDAAELYAQAEGARAMTVQVVRGGKPIALRIAIR